MKVIDRTAIVSATAVAAFLIFGTVASAQGPNKCIAGKDKCVSKKAQGLLKCHIRAEKNGLDVNTDPDIQICLAKARYKFDGVTGAALLGKTPDPTKGCVVKLELKDETGPGPVTTEEDCATFGDTAAMESKVDAFVDDVVAELDPAFPAPVTNDCSAGKKKCAMKKMAALLKCHEKAVKSGQAVPGPEFDVCDAKARFKYDGVTGAALLGKTPDPTKGCFAKLEANDPTGDLTGTSEDDCPTLGDSAALESKVDAFIADALCELGFQTLSCPAPACPTTYQFTASTTGGDLDYGWTGIAHDQHLPSMTRLSLAVSGCDSPVSPCGNCTASGPIPNAGGPAFASQRCRGDNLGNNGSWVPCTNNADCAGAGNYCTFYLGAPQPLAVGGVTLCQLNDVQGGALGTVNPDTGSASIQLPGLRSRIFSGIIVPAPCPRCVASLCDGGARNGLACIINGSYPLLGDTSLDCPPTAGAQIGTDIEMSPLLTTGTQTLTLAAASPNCRAAGFTTQKCFCDTCNNAAATPCTSNADCTLVGATVCGGRRCLSGANNGTPCAVNSECPAGVCGVAGTSSRPNQCDDGTCTPNGADTDSIDEGECAAGPTYQTCTIETFRGCLVDADCPASGDTCNLTDKNFQCFTTNGNVGDDVAVAGAASTTAPTLGALLCMPPSTASSINNVYGLPGLVRMTIPGTAVFN